MEVLLLRLHGLLRHKRGALAIRRRRRPIPRATDGRKAHLLHLGRGALDLDRRGLQAEGRGLVFLVGVHVLRALLLVAVVVGGRLPAAVAGAVGGEARGVGGGLGAQLGDVEVAAGAVAVGHGFAQLAFGVEAVEDYAVDGDGDCFHDDFDDGAE